VRRLEKVVVRDNPFVVDGTKLCQVHFVECQANVDDFCNGGFQPFLTLVAPAFNKHFSTCPAKKLLPS
jgi:hypothetical protein